MVTSRIAGTPAACARAACVGASALLLGAAGPPPAPVPPAPASAASDVPDHVLSPDLYRSVALKWNGGTAPLCAATRSWRDWEALTRNLTAKKDSGAPMADEWNRHAVLVLGRQINVGRAPVGFHVDGVHRQGSTIELDYSITPESAHRRYDVVRRRRDHEAVDADRDLQGSRPCGVHGAADGGTLGLAGPARATPVRPGPAAVRPAASCSTRACPVGDSPVMLVADCGKTPQ